MECGEDGRGEVPVASAAEYGKMVAGLERLLCDVIVAHGQREKNLLDQITTLRADIKHRSEAFQRTITHYRRQLCLHGRHDLCDSDSGVGEPDQFGVHVVVVLNRRNGSLGFNIVAEPTTANAAPASNEGSSTPSSLTTQTATAKDLIVSRVNPEGPSQGKLCLQDRILKVNGIDLSAACLDEAVGVIKGAQEPVVVEVVRHMSSAQLWPRLEDIACQTDVACLGSKEDARCVSEISEYSDELRKYDIEYEFLEEIAEYSKEVTLSKAAADTKLGITICYAHQSETTSDVFIEKVDPEGVAGIDGRIKQGDQIIQVNGVDVRDHKEAVGLFEAHSSVVSLVVARPHLKQDVDEPCNGQPNLSIMRSYHPISILEEDEEEEDLEGDDLGCRDVANEKDSGVGGGRTDESTRNDESCSEQEEVLPFARRNVRPSCSNVSLDDLLCDGVGALKLDNDADGNVKVTTEVGVGELDRSEAVELWVESTAANGATSRTIAEMFNPPPLDDGELSSVACECCVDRRPGSMLLPPPPPQPLSTLYTDRNNLEQTIRLQQQLLRRSFFASSSSTSSGRSPSSASVTTKNVSTARQDSSVPAADVMEWRVKRRADGSRYVVRRPVRSRLLRERAVQLAEERCGVTTDDDAASEMKAGRYWSKEDRKRHLEKAREHRRRKEDVIRSRGAAIAATNQSTNGGILEMSRRKMTRVRGRNLFDNFTTVQEVLAHGSCVDGKPPHRLLSVTTV